MNVSTADLLIIELLELENIDHSLLTMIQKEHQNGDFLNKQHVEILQGLLDTINFNFDKKKVLSYFQTRRWCDTPNIEEEEFSSIKKCRKEYDTKDIAFLKCEISTRIYKLLKNERQNYRELRSFLFEKFDEISNRENTKMDEFLNIALVGKLFLFFINQLFGFEMCIAESEKVSKDTFEMLEEAKDQIVYH